MSEDETLYPYLIRFSRSDRDILSFLRHDLKAPFNSHVLRACLRTVAIQRGYNPQTRRARDITDIHRGLKL